MVSTLKSGLVAFAGTEDDLEFYVRKCGEILGVTVKLDKDKRDAKHILEHVFFQIVEFKKLNQVKKNKPLAYKVTLGALFNNPFSTCRSMTLTHKRLSIRCETFPYHDKAAIFC